MDFYIFSILVLMSTSIYHTICKTSDPKKKSNIIEGQNKILGGNFVSIDKVPYQILIASNDRPTPFCGGSIISERHILTAAHCIDNDSGPYIILTGSDIFGQGTKNPVAKFVKHPKFILLKRRYDIAILTLARPLKFSSTVNKIILPKKNENFKAGQKALITGFGATKEDGMTSSYLMKVEVPTMPINICKKTKLYVPDIICAGFPEGRKDACQGDSGGPMVIGKKLVGIVSFGDGCGRANSPGYYTDVAKYIDYIMKETNNLQG